MAQAKNTLCLAFGKRMCELRFLNSCNQLTHIQWFQQTYHLVGKNVLIYRVATSDLHTKYPLKSNHLWLSWIQRNCSWTYFLLQLGDTSVRIHLQTTAEKISCQHQADGSVYKVKTQQADRHHQRALKIDLSKVNIFFPFISAHWKLLFYLDTVWLGQNILNCCSINYDTRALANASFALDQVRRVRTNFFNINSHRQRKHGLRNNCLAPFLSFIWRIRKVIKLFITGIFQVI